VKRNHSQPPTDWVCPSCNQLRRQLKALRFRNQHLLRRAQRAEALLARARQELAELEKCPPRRPPATASNSSLPPSANPPGAPRPTVKKPTGRKPGAQLGHAGTSRVLLPVERMNQVIAHRPAVCRHCQAELDAQAPARLVGRHQVAELPEVAVKLSEHQSFACRCGRCGKETRGMIPAEIVASTTGPRLCATIGLLGAWVKGSRRAIAEVVAEVLGCPIALGSISAREAELCDALAEPYRQLAAEVAQSPVKYVDETGWKLHGKDNWLLVGATAETAVFRIEKTRTRPALLRLLNEQTRGVICSDRAGIYDLWPLSRRQLCWAHLKRDFVAMTERGGPGQTLGQQALDITSRVFALWHRFRDKRLTRKALRRGVAPLRAKMKRLLKTGADCGQKKTAGMCRGLLKRENAMWRFVQTPGLDPTNNLAERMLRPAVIWRKKSFGSHSPGGCLYVQRMLSVIQTLRLRGQDVVAYLSTAVQAHRQGLPAPPLETTSPGKGRKPLEIRGDIFTATPSVRREPLGLRNVA
jgi:transposase